MSNTADKIQKLKSKNLAGRIEVTSLFSENNNYQVVRRGELTGADTHKDSQITLKSVEDLNLDETGGEGSYIRIINQEKGKIFATAESFDVEIPESNASAINAPTTEAVKTYVDSSIDALDMTISGMAANKTLKTLTETNGKIAAEFEDISITSSQINDKTNSYNGTSEVVVTGKALKEALDTLDVAEVGSDGSYLKIISETGGKISASAAAFDTNISSNSAVTAPTTNAVKTYVDNHASNTEGHANATATANGFMSATDKSNLDTLVASFNNDDANTTIDSIKEVLKAFENAPEATNIVNALAGKSDTDHTHGNISKDGVLSGAKMVVVTDGDYKITTSSNITITELDCLDGVTSNIQTQLDGKAASSHGTHVTTETVKDALGTGTGTSKYFREDGNWVTPPNDNTTYNLLLSNTNTSSTGSHVANTSNGSYVLLQDTVDQTTAASLHIKGYDGLSVTNTANGELRITGNKATSSTYGVVKSAANRTTTPTLITGETVDNRFYGVELDNNGKMFVNVPWTDSSLGTGHTHEIKLEVSTDAADLNLDFNSNYKLTAGGEAIIFKMPVYENKTAAENGTEISLVNTGDKYNWNAAKTHADSIHARTDATKVEASATNGNIKIDDSEVTVYTHPAGTNPHGTTAADVKAVSIVASQGLTDIEKSNARANIGAGTSNFEGYTSSHKLEATLVSDDASHRFVTDKEKATWNTTLKGEIKDGVLTITNM